MTPLRDVTFLSDCVAEAEGLRFFAAAGHLVTLADGTVIDMTAWRDNDRPQSRAAFAAAITHWLEANPRRGLDDRDAVVIDLVSRRRIA